MSPDNWHSLCKVLGQHAHHLLIQELYRSMFRLCVLSLSLCMFSVGCQKHEAPKFTSSEKVDALPGELQAAVRQELKAHTGSYIEPILLGDKDVSLKTLKLGQAVYEKRCVQCHGVNGDGQGPVAHYMYPRPRDYRRGIYKFTSTPYGAKPLKSDLVRTLKRGIHGTSMPSFKFIPDEELSAVTDYILTLTHRGELEEQLAMMADFEDEIDPELVEEESIPIVLGQWQRAGGEKVVAMTTQPVFTQDHIQRGKAAFLSKGCSKCHGEDGRGQTDENLAGDLKDTWGNPTRAADLTAGILRGGQEPMDVYQRIYSGINGTPMPGFANAFREEPDTIWDLVAYVMSVTNTRRSGTKPYPGRFAPYIPPTEQEVVANE